MDDVHAAMIAKNPPAGEAGAPPESFAALQRAHLDLLIAHSEAKRDPKHALEAATEIRAFIARGRAAGALVEDPKERRAAQAILDYWSAELVSLPRETTNEGFMSARLAPLDDRRSASATAELPAPESASALAQSAECPASATAEPAAPDTKAEDRSREVIRFAATARLWRDHGKRHGYLLYGDAIGQAAKFRHLDPDIDALVEASLVWQTKRRLLIGLSLFIPWVGVIAFLLGAGALYWVHFRTLPKWSEDTIKLVQSGVTESQRAGLRKLARYQPYLPPEVSSFDLSGIVFEDKAESSQSKEIDLSDLTIYLPNFTLSRFSNVRFEGATLIGALFKDSPRIEDVQFKGADLTYAQFVRANIVRTSFSRAKLYRATFDGARLCDVDFSGADLNGASFRSVRLSADFAARFNTAWWRAVGWSPKQLSELAEKQKSPDLDSHFWEYRGLYEASFSDAAEGSIDHALALNGLAWTLATYGIDISPTKEPPAESKNGCPKGKDIPNNALDAAEQAVCIVTALNREQGNAKPPYRYEQANFQDTLGYVLMQAGRDRLPDARRNLTQAFQVRGDGSDGELMFRYAVAEFASGNEAEGREKLEISLTKGYIPSHERRMLKDYITGSFEDDLNRNLQIGESQRRTCDPAPSPQKP